MAEEKATSWDDICSHSEALLEHSCNHCFHPIEQLLELAIQSQERVAIDAFDLISHLPGNTRHVNISFPIRWDLNYSLKR